MDNDSQTFLIPRPFWVNDLDQTHCHSCNNTFGPLRRRAMVSLNHFYRFIGRDNLPTNSSFTFSGNIFCHDCSNRSIPLPQLGYGSLPVRVCNQCLEVAYLVTYVIDEDHGSTTQRMHWNLAFGDTSNVHCKLIDHDLVKLVQNGGIDALIWLCRSQRNGQLHFYATSALAILSEKESIRPVILTKCALRPLIQLMALYLSKPMSAPSKGSPILSAVTEPVRDDIRLEVLLNCTHVIFQLGRAGMLSPHEINNDGALLALLQLADYKYTPFHIASETEEKEDMQQLLDREQMIQSVAAKGISAICATVSNQPAIFEVISNPDQLTDLLKGNNILVSKYIAKSIAYLSLRNDKYKSLLLQGNGASILVQKLHNETVTGNNSAEVDKASDETNSDQTSNLEASTIANVCCAIANFATNGESQQKLMTQPHLLQNLCATAASYSGNTEIHRHIARSFANFALYGKVSCNSKNNRKNMLRQINKKKNVTYNVMPTLLAIGQSPNVTPDVRRHVVRAIDNLSNQEITDQNRTIFEQVVPLMKEWTKDITDADLVKRAENICRRFE
ncbi:hypothetical protein INT43_005612 [Umbelopsis isabellina]|uniref:FYVE zinc finger domain-containing protein n=1 Tax=Mortierella isabellina TaxID=91625 RepID=A0A8H7UDY2_MORIS|nr:hypothetical protein INT43_005612 [Umbelopsis isabellina]